MPKTAQIRALRFGLWAIPIVFSFVALIHGQIGGATQGGVQRGQGPAHDWSNESPGARHLISTADLPKPGDTEAATMNMQLGRLARGRAVVGSLLEGSAHDLRSWRQP